MSYSNRVYLHNYCSSSIYYFRFFFTLLSLPLTLTSLFFSFPLSPHSHWSTFSHAVKTTLSFHQISSLSPTHIVHSSPIVNLLWIRSTLSDHSCWFSLDRRLGCGGLFLLIADLFFFFFGWAWGCHDSDYGCGSMVLVIVGVGRWVANLFFELFFSCKIDGNFTLTDVVALR